MKKLITRFAATLAGSVALLTVGATGLAAADININVSGPGASVVVNGGEDCGNWCNKHEETSCNCHRKCHHVVKCHWVWSCHRWCQKPCDR